MEPVSERINWGCDYPSYALRSTMVDETSEDDIIRERAFRISDKLDIGDLVDSSLFEEKKDMAVAPKEEDEAIGEIFDPFSNSKRTGAIERDGTVRSAPERDIVTDVAMDGERRIN